jgi:hypothetical protein
MKPGDRLVCAFVKPPGDRGTQFTEWPLHVTIVPWFRSDISSEKLAAELQFELADIAQFPVMAGPSAGFGYKKGKTASLIQLSTPFTEIEPRVRRTLKQQKAWLVDETTRQRHEYKPHVTNQKSGRLHKGDKFYCDRLYIIEQKGSHKQITASVALST